MLAGEAARKPGLPGGRWWAFMKPRLFSSQGLGNQLTFPKHLLGGARLQTGHRGHRCDLDPVPTLRVVTAGVGGNRPVTSSDRTGGAQL